jgi:hypothetical protein
MQNICSTYLAVLQATVFANAVDSQKSERESVLTLSESHNVIRATVKRFRRDASCEGRGGRHRTIAQRCLFCKIVQGLPSFSVRASHSSSRLHTAQISTVSLARSLGSSRSGISGHAQVRRSVKEQTQEKSKKRKRWRPAHSVEPGCFKSRPRWTR